MLDPKRNLETGTLEQEPRYLAACYLKVGVYCITKLKLQFAKGIFCPLENVGVK